VKEGMGPNFSFEIIMNRKVTKTKGSEKSIQNQIRYFLCGVLPFI
jgi:hypothetical protein